MSSEEFDAKVGDRMVTVRTLQVDGRKLTLQFFRQIPREDWLDEALEPRQDIRVWGRVHYAIKGEGTEWLLVQEGDQLKRCNFDRVERSMANIAFYEASLERAIDRVARLTAEVEEKTAKAATEKLEALKKIYESSAETSSRWLKDAKVSEEEVRKTLAERIEQGRRYEVRRRHMEALSPTLEQIFIG